MGAPTIEEIIPGHQAWIVVAVGDAARVQIHDRAQVRHLIADVECLVDLFLIFGEQHARLRVVQHVLDLRRRVGRVEPDRCGADGGDTDIAEQPFGPVLAVDGDSVAGLHAEGQQTVPDERGLLPVRGPRDFFPQAKILLAHRDARGGFCCATADGLRESFQRGRAHEASSSSAVPR